VLDVATGTGRVPLLLLAQADFTGLVVGVDRSLRMMAQAEVAAEQYNGRVIFMRQDAAALAFGSEAFDCVTCLEALEFMPDPTMVLREMVRVLRPGGLLLLSNRVGKDAWLFPARLCGRGKLEGRLRQLGLEKVAMQRWQTHYDLVWAHKAAATEKPTLP
jgi:ubiquinone/menaquinone biosynthesis C-methylase UbiE